MLLYQQHENRQRAKDKLFAPRFAWSVMEQAIFSGSLDDTYVLRLLDLVLVSVGGLTYRLVFPLALIAIN
jgi:hypothetical protein